MTNAIIQRPPRAILSAKKSNPPSEVARALAAPSLLMGGLYGMSCSSIEAPAEDDGVKA